MATALAHAATDRAAERYAAEATAAGLPPEAAAPGGTTTLSALDPDLLAHRILTACQQRRSELVVPRKVGLHAGLIEWFPDAGRWLLARVTQPRR